MKKLLIITLLLWAAEINAQYFELSIQQDPKMLFEGNGKTSDDHAVNILTRASLHQYKKPKKISYFSLYGSFEYSDLRTTFQRYALGVSYNLELCPKFTGVLSYDLGIISRGFDYSRDKKNLLVYESNSFQSIIKFKINDKFGILATAQLTQRTDKIFYKPGNQVSKDWVFSTFGGLYYNISKIK